MKGYERKMMGDGLMSGNDAEIEISKYEDWKPKRHSLVV
jgi:cyanate lyase